MPPAAVANMTVAEILGELVGHFAYDTGCVSSGVSDRVRRAELAAALDAAFDLPDYRQQEARWARDHWLSEKALSIGYGMEDAAKFHQWIEDGDFRPR